MRLLSAAPFLPPPIHLLQTAQPTDLFGWLTGSAVTVLAVVVVGFLKRWIVTGAELANAIARAEKAEAKADALNAYIQDRMLPTMVRVSDVLARGVEVAATEVVSRSRREDRP